MLIIGFFIHLVEYYIKKRLNRRKIKSERLFLSRILYTIFMTDNLIQ